MNNPKTEEIVKALRECKYCNDEICEACPSGAAYGLGCREELGLIAADRLEVLEAELTALKARQRWIPVTERLPDIYEKDPGWSTTVLFMTSKGHVHSGYRNIGRAQKSFYDDDWTPPYWLDESEDLSFEEEEVTHWMPLPVPPKEEK